MNKSRGRGVERGRSSWINGCSIQPLCSSYHAIHTSTAQLPRHKFPASDSGWRQNIVQYTAHVADFHSNHRFARTCATTGPSSL